MNELKTEGNYINLQNQHPKKPADIYIGKPHDLNPSSYADTKMILRKLEYQNTELETDHG